jgi:methionyl-tRNA formyltransferase
LFKYDAGVDSGMIVGTQKFDINVWDDCNTLHLKNRIAMNRLLKHHLPGLFTSTQDLTPQCGEIEPTYFPKRTAEDGRIVWEDHDMNSLYNFIRAQTRPFPGAFSYLEGGHQPFHLWRGHPFDGHLVYPGSRPGEIVEVFRDGSFAVAVWDGAVRVYDYSPANDSLPKLGERFTDTPSSRES